MSPKHLVMSGMAICVVAVFIGMAVKASGVFG